jgi:hypothetical protein
MSHSPPVVRHSEACAITENVDVEGSSESAFGSLSLEVGHNKSEFHPLAVSFLLPAYIYIESVHQRSESPLFEPMDDAHSRSPSPVSAEDNMKSVTTTTTTTRNPQPSLNYDGLHTARLLKATLTTGIPVHAPTRKTKKRVEDDPENALIKTLRQHHSMEWSAIANFLNEERLKRGEPANLTHPAVYSRFVRNAPRVAAKEGEVGFDPKDYMHLRHPAQYVDPRIVKGVGGAYSRKRGRNGSAMSTEGEEEEEEVEEEVPLPKELQGNVRKRSKLAEESAELQSVERTTKLVEAAATVHRNFWVMVADELERTTGTLYDPKVGAARYASL